MRVVSLVVVGAICPAAFAQVEPILFSDGPIPGVTTAGGQPATIWQTGLFRVRNSPDRSRWAIRVNQNSANDNEYIVAGQGLTANTIVHSLGDTSTVPPTSVGVFYISERGLGINDAGNLALSGSTAARATSDTVWLIRPGIGATIAAQENNPAFLRPNGLGQFRNISGGTISNTDKITIAEETALGTDTEQAILWDNGTYTELAAEFGTLANVPGRLIQNINGFEPNAQRGSVFFFENAGGANQVVAFSGDLDGLSTDDNFFAVRDNATNLFNSVYRELDVIDGRQIGSPTSNVIPIGWIDADANTYCVSFTTTDIFGFINRQLVIDNGQPVGGNIPGETWAPANIGFAIAPVIALDRNRAGGYIVGGTTSNTETFNAIGSSPALTSVRKNQVIIYVAPDGTRTELVRVGDPVQVVVNGVQQTRRIVTLAQQDSTFAAYIDDTHLYFLAGTEFFAGTVPDDMFARVALPTGGGCRPDFNNDGTVDINDFFAFLSAYSANEPRADINDDGAVNIDDFFSFLSLYAEGC